YQLRRCIRWRQRSFAGEAISSLRTFLQVFQNLPENVPRSIPRPHVYRKSILTNQSLPLRFVELGQGDQGRQSHGNAVGIGKRQPALRNSQVRQLNVRPVTQKACEGRECLRGVVGFHSYPSLSRSSSPNALNSADASLSPMAKMGTFFAADSLTAER